MVVPWRKFPTVYEINAFVWTAELGASLGRPPLTLAEIPDPALDELGDLGFDGVWLMGVWRRSRAARELALTIPELRVDYERALPDFRDEDVAGSPYAVADYQVDRALGGDPALVNLRERLARRGLRLMLDFVPNHLARDHAWVRERPELFVQADEAALARQPGNYFRAVDATGRPRVLAHGRDPYFPGWTDTVQLDYRRAETRRAMADTLVAVAERCDGLRCDMAMLVTSEVFARTWGGAFDQPGSELWPDAIGAVRARAPGFVMLAEVYWDLEPALLAMGFDFAYDKRLYDALVAGETRAIEGRLRAPSPAPERLAHFIENHDEARAAAALGAARSRAAAVVAFGAPGLRLVHQGQLEGCKVKLPVQLRRRRAEPADPETVAFYRELLATLRRPAPHDGEARPLQALPASGHGDASSVFAWQWQLGHERSVLAANFAAAAVACRLSLPEGGDLAVDLPPFGYRLMSAAVGEP